MSLLATYDTTQQTNKAFDVLADIAEGQAVKLSGAGVVPCDTEGEPCIGVAQFSAPTGKRVTVAMLGLTGLITSVALDAATDGLLMVAADGYFKPYVDDGTNVPAVRWLPTKLQTAASPGHVIIGLVFQGQPQSPLAGAPSYADFEVTGAPAPGTLVVNDGTNDLTLTLEVLDGTQTARTALRAARVDIGGPVGADLQLVAVSIALALNALADAGDTTVRGWLGLPGDGVHRPEAEVGGAPSTPHYPEGPAKAFVHRPAGAVILTSNVGAITATNA